MVHKYFKSIARLAFIIFVPLLFLSLALNHNKVHAQFTGDFGAINASISWGTESLTRGGFFSARNLTTGFTASPNTGFVFPPGDYVVSAGTAPNGGDGVYIGDQYLTVVGGQTNTLHFDAQSVTGLVKGSIKVNGQLADGQVQFCAVGGHCDFYASDGPLYTVNGNFNIGLAPGSYVAHAKYATSDLGSVQIVVVAGQILDFNTSSVLIPTGQNVTVSLNGIEITFANVSSSGYLSLTTTNNAQGGPVPSEYRFLGNYYELTTSANYSGPVTVKFIYEDSSVHGQEANLKLFHWDGATWQNITVPPVDTINNVITGSTQTLSPFILGEPLFSPIVGTIKTSLDPHPINQVVNVSADFTYEGSNGLFTAMWDWGDGTTSSGLVDQQNKYVNSSHTYTTAGVYTIKLVITKENSGSGEAIFQYVVIYNPEGGYVTGGGTVDSPIGSYIPDASLSGKASFGFVSKYEQGATVPTGQTEFQFRAANFKFRSQNYEWLVIAGSHAKYKGEGTINGEGGYAFMLTAIDGQVGGGGGVDKLRIKIWKKDNNQLVYDNQLGSSDSAEAINAINNGSIVIHN